jgi:hypothetical protein
MNKTIIVPPCADESESELFFSVLDGLLPVDQALSVNTAHLIVSLVSTKPASANPILMQRLLTEMQLRLLLSLLKSPRCCSYEILLASFFCSYRGLLAGLFSPQPAARDEWLAVVQEAGMLLERAQMEGTWRKELKHLYNMLSELRIKLRPFGLGIAICISGVAYALIPLPASQQEAPGPDSFLLRYSSPRRENCSPEREKLSDLILPLSELHS